MEVLLQPAEVADLNIPPHRDPREVYLERLFQPGRFSKQDIRRALSVSLEYIFNCYFIPPLQNVKFSMLC